MANEKKHKRSGSSGSNSGSGKRASTKTKALASVIVLAIAAVLMVTGAYSPGSGGSGTDGSGKAATTKVASTKSSSGSGSSDSGGSASSDVSESLAAQLTNAPSSQVSAAEKGELEFRNANKLSQHFEKHGEEVGASSEDTYVAAANAVVANGDALHKEESEDGDDVYFLQSTGELVVVSQKGYLRTYFITDLDYFERQ